MIRIFLPYLSITDEILGQAGHETQKAHCGQNHWEVATPAPSVGPMSATEPRAALQCAPPTPPGSLSPPNSVYQGGLWNLFYQSTAFRYL